MYEVNASSSVILVISFYDWNDNLIVPDSLSFIIYDKATSTVKRSGSLDPWQLDDTIEFTLTPSDTSILLSRNRSEIIVVAIQFTYGSYTGVDEYEIKILNSSVI